MIIQINNVGPISSYEFDLEKDFHIIVGENNAGKSYAVSIVYLIIKLLIQKSHQYLNKSLPLPLATYSIKDNRANYSAIVKRELELFFYDLFSDISTSFCATFESLAKMRNDLSEEQTFV
ncbi:MAG: ATP-binding protein, partial [Magnetococcales bacterium]|nr:ATP-binding protein [Magnetococcales bacterium]